MHRKINYFISVQLGINNPRDEMQVEQFGVTLPYGREIDVAIYPEVLLAEKDAKDIELVSISK